jgi:DNA-binding MurR/RpiR family transcriptional regulator
LREILNNLTNSEKKVAEFILKDPEKLMGLSIAELSGLSGGSQAAVIRLCKSLGVKGYKDLMIQVAGDLREREIKNEDYQEIRKFDSMEDIVRNVSLNNVQSINDTLKVLDVGMVGKAVEALIGAERIFLYGLGASNMIAADAQHKFMRINKTCFSFADPDMQLMSSTMLTKEDIVIGISYSGNTTHVVTCIQSAKAVGATTITITKYGNNPVARSADIPLYISALENEIRSGAMASRISQLNVIDILYLGVVSRDLGRSIDYLKKTREIVKNANKMK